MRKRLFTTFFLLVLCIITTDKTSADTINLDAKNLSQKSILFISPPSGTFIEGSSFEVPVYINTKGQAINAIDLYVNYDSKKLSVIQPVGTKSIISLWLEAPNYSSSDGTIKLTGTIPGGIIRKADSSQQSLLRPYRLDKQA